MRVVIGLMAALTLAAPPEAEVQGLYEGTLKDVKFEARVIAMGKDAYKIYLRQDLGGGKVGKVELDGKVDGEAVTFKSKGGDVEWSVSYAGSGSLKGTAGGAAFEAKRVERKSPTMGKKPAQGAIVMLDGKNFDQINPPRTARSRSPRETSRRSSSSTAASITTRSSCAR